MCKSKYLTFSYRNKKNSNLVASIPSTQLREVQNWNENYLPQFETKTLTKIEKLHDLKTISSSLNDIDREIDY